MRQVGFQETDVVAIFNPITKYAVQIQDNALFVKTLSEIIATPVDSFPERNLANEVAKRKAKDLLEKVDTLF